jgi:hypothetical protein
LPPLPLRQWVLSVPKRLRYFLHDDVVLQGVVVRILLRAIALSNGLALPQVLVHRLPTDSIRPRQIRLRNPGVSLRHKFVDITRC